MNLLQQYCETRRVTEGLCRPLEIEDYGLQCMDDVSPPKWHLAHTTWFFETFVLRPELPAYRIFHSRFHELFNSYYLTAGAPLSRSRRGRLSRPTVAEIYAYRRHVDEAMRTLLGDDPQAVSPQAAGVVELGIHHEQQHQELLLMDIKYNFWCNPLRPTYLEPRSASADHSVTVSAPGWVGFASGIREIGDRGERFAFDNEKPRHLQHLESYSLADRPVTCGEFLEFIEAGGYGRPELWLSDGWDAVSRLGWNAPLYWELEGGEWRQYTLREGMRRMDEAEPVCHISYFEADAFARWSGKRLPTEGEWETAANSVVKEEGDVMVGANFLESGELHPRSLNRASGGAASRPGLQKLFGDVWEWTQSAYSAYPGYSPLQGTLGEYNGKFMNNNLVLRGGACVTPGSHLRVSYRNFYRPDSRWHFSGVRLCRNGKNE